MGETKTPRFYDFGFFEPVTNPQNQLFLSLETPGHQKKTRKPQNNFRVNSFINFGVSKHQWFDILSKRRAPNNDEDFFKKSRKSRIWDQCLPDNMKGFFGIE